MWKEGREREGALVVDGSPNYDFGVIHRQTPLSPSLAPRFPSDGSAFTLSTRLAFNHYRRCGLAFLFHINTRNVAHTLVLVSIQRLAFSLVQSSGVFVSLSRHTVSHNRPSFLFTNDTLTLAAARHRRGWEEIVSRKYDQ